jgi:hypothetical protein
VRGHAWLIDSHHSLVAGPHKLARVLWALPCWLSRALAVQAESPRWARAQRLGSPGKSLGFLGDWRGEAGSRGFCREWQGRWQVGEAECLFFVILLLLPTQPWWGQFCAVPSLLPWPLTRVCTQGLPTKAAKKKEGNSGPQRVLADQGRAKASQGKFTSRARLPLEGWGELGKGGKWALTPSPVPGHTF